MSREIWEVEKRDVDKAITVLTFLTSRGCDAIACPTVTRGENADASRYARVRLEYSHFTGQSTLHQFITTSAGNSDDVVRTLSHQLVEGVAAMHASHVYHQFLSSDDVLVVPDGGENMPQIKITNFFNSSVTTDASYICVRNYRSPEVMLQLSNIDRAGVDCWALGCLVFEILCGTEVFSLVSSKDASGACRPQLLKQQLHSLVEALGTQTEDDVTTHCPPRIRKFLLDIHCEAAIPQRIREKCAGRVANVEEWVNLVMGLLRFNPASRLSAKDALQSPVFQGLTSSYHTPVNTANMIAALF